MKATKYLYALAAAATIWLASSGGHAHSLSHAEALTDLWVDAFNSRDRIALAALYREDAELAQHNAPTLVGRDHIGIFWARHLAKGATRTLATVTSTLDGTDFTLVHGTYRVIDRDGRHAIRSGEFAQIWRLDAGEWRIDRDIRSDDGEKHE